MGKQEQQGERTIKTTIRRFICDGCKVESPVGAILKEKVWKKIAKKKHKIYCFKCMERKLGRKITIKDLKPCGLMAEMLIGALLVQRAGLKVREGKVPLSMKKWIKMKKCPSNVFKKG